MEGVVNHGQFRLISTETLMHCHDDYDNYTYGCTRLDIGFFI